MHIFKIYKYVHEVKSYLTTLNLYKTYTPHLSQLLEVVDTWEIVRLKAEMSKVKVLTKF